MKLLSAKNSRLQSPYLCYIKHEEIAGVSYYYSCIVECGKDLNRILLVKVSTEHQ